MKNTVKILGRDYELFASTQAVSEISEMCGGINHIAEYIYGTEQEPNGQIEQIKRVIAIIEKMIEGRINKFFKEICLLDQVFVKNSDLTIAQYLNGAKIYRFVRYAMGEGLQKREDNFAEEVMKQIK